MGAPPLLYPLLCSWLLGISHSPDQFKSLWSVDYSWFLLLVGPSVAFQRRLPRGERYVVAGNFILICLSHPVFRLQLFQFNRCVVDNFEQLGDWRIERGWTTDVHNWSDMKCYIYVIDSCVHIGRIRLINPTSWLDGYRDMIGDDLNSHSYLL